MVSLESIGLKGPDSTLYSKQMLPHNLVFYLSSSMSSVKSHSPMFSQKLTFLYREVKCRTGTKESCNLHHIALRHSPLEVTSILRTKLKNNTDNNLEWPQSTLSTFVSSCGKTVLEFRSSEFESQDWPVFNWVALGKITLLWFDFLQL